MKRLKFLLLLLSIVTFATGCPKPKYRPTLNFNQGMVSKFNAALKQQYREYECYRFGPEHIDFQNVKCDNFTEDQTKAKAIRNELIENALSFIDESYVNFISDIQEGRDRDNFLLDLVELGTTASVGITNGERPLQILGVALTAFRGGRKSIDVNFYKETTVPILVSKMDDNRAKVRTIILQREEKKAASDLTRRSSHRLHRLSSTLCNLWMRCGPSLPGPKYRIFPPLVQLPIVRRPTSLPDEALRKHPCFPTLRTQ